MGLLDLINVKNGNLGLIELYCSLIYYCETATYLFSQIGTGDGKTVVVS